MSERKNILITGASSGIGLTSAVYLIYKGYNVIGTSRNPSALDIGLLKERFERDNRKWKVVRKKTEEGVRYIAEPGKFLVAEKIRNMLLEILKKLKFIRMDLTDMQSVQNCIEEAENYFSDNSDGGIDVLCNIAGNGYFGPVEELDFDRMYSQFEVNFWGTIRTVRSVLPYMRKRKSGLIINFSSMAAYTCIPFQAMYSSTKSAVITLTLGLIQELGPFGIKAAAVCPGDINTDFDARTFRLHFPDKSVNSTDIGEMAENVPIGENSVYKPYASTVWKTVVENLIAAPPPITVAHTLLKIIRSKNPRPVYNAGSFIQKVQMFIMSHFMSKRSIVKSTEKFYGLR